MSRDHPRRDPAPRDPAPRDPAPRDRPPRDRPPGSGLTRTGGALFVLGSVLVVLTVVPPLLSGGTAPGVLAALAWAVPSLGLALLLLGLHRAARAESRAARRLRDAHGGPGLSPPRR